MESEIMRRVLRGVRVDLGDEFDRNFERQSYFGEAWARRKSPLRAGGAILVDTGALRKSIVSRADDDSITFYTDLPYAAIHNEGGEIVVTRRMKGYFWRKYYEARGGFGRKKDGSLRNDKRTRRLVGEAEFYKFMALKKEGSVIRIPRRRFLGGGAAVERIVRETVESELRDFFEHEYKLKDDKR